MTWGIATVAVVAVVLLLAMARGWRTRATRTAALVPPPVPAPDDAALGEPRVPVVAAVYVSTTFAGQPLERVVAHGLGTRSAAEVSVHDAGVLLRRGGAADLFVPVQDLVDVHTAAGMAGKVVGGDGLVVLTWQAHDDAGRTVRLDTGLRTRHRADRTTLTAALAALIAPTTAVPADEASPTAAPTTEEHP